METTPARKLREVRMALTMEQTLRDQAKREKGLSDVAAKQEAKKQIVTRYLNVVPFGNNSYGIEAAARRPRFGKKARTTLAESALLAGAVQSSEALNPYRNPEGARVRRNTVLDTMLTTSRSCAPISRRRRPSRWACCVGPHSAAGCISAGDDGLASATTRCSSWRRTASRATRYCGVVTRSARRSTCRFSRS